MAPARMSATHTEKQQEREALGMHDVKPMPRLSLDVVAPFLRSAPVDIRAAADALGIRVAARILSADVSGKIECDPRDGTCAITVNAIHSETRQRFTIAHELAHYLLHRDLIGDGIVDDALYRKSSVGDEYERQANRFAASLLMPQRLVKALWEQGVRSPNELGTRFHVSPAVAEIRLRELGLR